MQTCRPSAWSSPSPINQDCMLLCCQGLRKVGCCGRLHKVPLLQFFLPLHIRQTRPTFFRPLWVLNTAHTPDGPRQTMKPKDWGRSNWRPISEWFVDDLTKAILVCESPYDCISSPSKQGETEPDSRMICISIMDAHSVSSFHAFCWSSGQSSWSWCLSTKIWVNFGVSGLSSILRVWKIMYWHHSKTISTNVLTLRMIGSWCAQLAWTIFALQEGLFMTAHSWSSWF